MYEAKELEIRLECCKTGLVPQFRHEQNIQRRTIQIAVTKDR